METLTTFHDGERAVQQRAGVAALAARVGAGIRPFIAPAMAEFLREQRIAVVAHQDAAGAVWASLLSGAAGFLQPLDARTLRVDAAPAVGDPLARLRRGDAVGLLAIEFATRRRMRLNGTADPLPGGGLLIAAREVYANCPKYIQRRTWTAAPKQPQAPAVWSGTTLTAELQAWLASADTFFIASAHPGAGADASHRGGQPGFVRVLDATRLAFPDYAGNNMFNTLGNLATHPGAGLLFVDWARGATLQLSGTAQVHWSADWTASFAGAERVVEFRVQRVVTIDAATALRAELVDYSPFNPTG